MNLYHGPSFDRDHFSNLKDCHLNSMSSVFIIGQHSQNACPIPNTDIESELLTGDMSKDKISNTRTLVVIKYSF